MLAVMTSACELLAVASFWGGRYYTILMGHQKGFNERVLVGAALDTSVWHWIAFLGESYNSAEDLVCRQCCFRGDT